MPLIRSANAYLASKQDRPGWHMSREQRMSSGPRTVTVWAHQHELSGENSRNGIGTQDFCMGGARECPNDPAGCGRGDHRLEEGPPGDL